jgi:hypothetical protein
MKRALLLALMISVGSWRTAAVAQDFDPKEAIVGAWMPDWASVLKQAPVDPDGKVDQSSAMYTGMAMKLTVSIDREGLISWGETPSDIELSISMKMQDNGSLLVLPGWLEMPYPINVRFDGPDRFFASRAAPDPRLPVNFEFRFDRLFDQDCVKNSEVNLDTNRAVHGAWVADIDRFDELELLRLFSNNEQREGIIKHFSTNSKYAFQINEDSVSYLNDDRSEIKYSLDYRIIASNESAVLLSVEADNSQRMKPYLWRFDVTDPDHCVFWYEGIRIPMIRIKEVTPADD